MKERLTGAIILVALIVLLVPELLTGPIHSAPALAANSSEEPPLRTYTIHLAEDGRSRADTPDSGPAMPQPNEPGQVAAATTPQAAASPGSSDETGADASRSPSVNPAPNASIASNQSPAQSPSSATSAMGGSAGKPTASPNQTAEASQNGRAAHAATERSHSPTAKGAWMVQLGVFASRENAEHLAQDMRAKGFKAAVSDVTSGSHRLFRVRVGPTTDRSAAQDLLTRLRAAGRAGTVVPVS